MSLTPTKGKPAIPEFIEGEARAEFVRVCDELEAMGILSTADRGVIAMYAKAWQRWVEAERQLAIDGVIIPSAKTKVPQHSLWLTVSNTAQERMTALAKELCLTPKARRIAGKAPESEDVKDKNYEI